MQYLSAFSLADVPAATRHSQGAGQNRRQHPRGAMAMMLPCARTGDLSLPLLCNTRPRSAHERIRKRPSAAILTALLCVLLASAGTSDAGALPAPRRGLARAPASRQAPRHPSYLPDLHDGFRVPCHCYPLARGRTSSWTDGQAGWRRRAQTTARRYLAVIGWCLAVAARAYQPDACPL
jgi:hypothetical protein